MKLVMQTQRIAVHVANMAGKPVLYGYSMFIHARMQEAAHMLFDNTTM